MTINFEEFKEAHSEYSSVGAHREESWKDVLDILNKEGWGPYEYIDFIFRDFRKALVPSLLSNPTIVEAYREERRSRIQLNKRRADWALNQVQIRLRNKMLITDILADKELENHALLMYLIASVDKNKDAMDRLREAAVYESRTMPELLDIYSAKFNRRLFP